MGRTIISGDVTIPTVAPSSSSGYRDKATVLAVQTALKAKGFNPGPLDGIYGPKTAAAIKASGASSAGIIDYGVLAALGVQAPGTSGAMASAQAASTLADATQAAHAGAGLDDTKNDAQVEAQVQAARAAVDTAKVKVAAAATPQAAQVAKQQLAVAEQHLASVEPSSNFLMKNVGVINRPLWQVLLGGLGLAVATTGVVLLVGGRKKR